jgi:hypothetical protein
MVDCLHCKKSTQNPKFCCASCAAIYNNQHRLKVKKKYYCIKCGEFLYQGWRYSRQMVCASCNQRPIRDENVTLQSLKDTYDINQYHAKIRGHSRSVAKSLPKVCEVCGYDKHVEICHIKELKDFNMSATLKEVNDITNLKVLCPNHHWELDNLTSG